MSEPERTDVYVRLADIPAGSTLTTHEVKGFGLDGLFIDVDEHGRAVGIEILDAAAVDINGKVAS